MKGFLVPLFLLFFLPVCNGQERSLLTFEVLDSKTQNPVDEVELVIPKLDRVFQTDKSGIVELLVPTTSYLFTLSHSDYEEFSYGAIIQHDTVIQILLKPLFNLYKLEEVDIVSKTIDKVKSEQISVEEIDQQTLKLLPLVGGEKDIVKAFALLPGVQVGTEASSDLIVRGGLPSQNLFLWDGIPLYGGSKFLGFLSPYNPWAIQSAQLFKGGFPSEYGGRLSSVLDVTSKNPNVFEFSGEASIGAVSSNLGINIPLLPGKLGLIASGRRTYTDLFVRLFSSSSQVTLFSFHDIFSKLYFAPNDKHTLSLGTYLDRDTQLETNDLKEKSQLDSRKLKIEKNTRLYYGQWEARWSPNLQHKLTVSQNFYALSLEEDIVQPDSSDSFFHLFQSSLEEFRVQGELQWQVNPNVQVKFGTQYSRYNFRPADTDTKIGSIQQSLQKIPQASPQELNGFGKIQYSFRPGHKLMAGLRFSNYFVDQKTYAFLEPRLALQVFPDSASSIKLGYARMTQPIHLLYNPGLGQPINLWMSATRDLAPGVSDQFSFGYARDITLKEKHFTLSGELWYKEMRDILEYRDGFSSQSLTTSDANQVNSFEQILTSGQGKSYGLELLFEKKRGKLRGWLGYTLSWTRHTFPELNGGEPFFSQYDRRNDLSVVALYQVSDNFSLSASWTYATGQPITLPVSAYNSYWLDPVFEKSFTTATPAIYSQSARNAFRMKDFHRLDVSGIWKIKSKFGQANLEVGLYNTYNRRNPFYYYVDNGIYGSPVNQNLISVSLFPVIPAINFTQKFGK